MARSGIFIVWVRLRELDWVVEVGGRAVVVQVNGLLELQVSMSLIMEAVYCKSFPEEEFMC